MKHQQITVTHTAVKRDFIAVEALRQSIHKRLGALFGNMPGGIITENSAFHRHEVATPGNVVRAELDPLADSLNGTASGIETGKIITEHGHIGGIG